MTRGGLIVIAAQLCACTMIAHEKVQGWPELLIVEHHVSEREMRERCVP